MRVLTLDAVTAALVADGVVTVIPVDEGTDYRGRVLIRAEDEDAPATMTIGTGWNGHGFDHEERQAIERPGAVVASGTLADVVPIVPRKWPQEVTENCVSIADDGRLVLWTLGQNQGRNITDQRPYGDFSPTRPCPTCGCPPGPPHHVYGERKCCPDCRHPQRWALIVEDVKPTTERCPRCWGFTVDLSMPCPSCDGAGVCEPVPMPGHLGQWTDPEWSDR
jgi:hypothetical protein